MSCNQKARDRKEYQAKECLKKLRKLSGALKEVKWEIVEWLHFM